MAKKKRAATLSVVKLAAAVEKAAQQLAKETNVTLESSLRLGPGTILGRMLRDPVTMEAAQQIAGEITAKVGKTVMADAATTTLSPAVLVLDKRIIVGFIDPSRSGMTFDQ
jgi:hypothetical protein